tara:strand:- start:185 stop:664 length:480 start_codon:yes stop_codon:yes gene_type:complete
MENVFEYLENLGVSYELFEHVAVFSVHDAQEAYTGKSFAENKNLFLRNRKGDTHYLVTVPASKKVDLDVLAEKLGEKDLSFASPKRLEKYLGVERGSVSPFCLLNDAEGEVIFIMDTELCDSELFGFHPNVNTKTVILSRDGFEKYLESVEQEVRYMDI